MSDAVIDYDLTHYDLAISHWVQSDPQAEQVLQHTYKTRMDFVRKAFRELGFKGDDLEMRTRLFTCYASNEQLMFGPCDSAKDRRLRKLRIQLLISSSE